MAHNMRLVMICCALALITACDVVQCLTEVGTRHHNVTSVARRHHNVTSVARRHHNVTSVARRRHNVTSVVRRRAGHYEHVWPDLKFGWRIVVGSIVGSLGAAFGSVGGVGGGGIFVPMLTLIIGFDAKSSTALSKCMNTGASVTTIYYNLKRRHPTLDLPIIDYDLALLIQPMLVLGISIGVGLNVLFAYWMITILLIVLFLITSTKAFLMGIKTWKKETIKIQEVDTELQPTGTGDHEDGTNCAQPEVKEQKREKFPVAGAVTVYEAVALYRGKKAIASKGDAGSQLKVHQLVLYCTSGLMAGIVGGLLGLGGGFILGPVFLELGIPPQYYLLKRFPVPYGKHTCILVIFNFTTYSIIVIRPTDQASVCYTTGRCPRCRIRPADHTPQPLVEDVGVTFPHQKDMCQNEHGSIPTSNILYQRLGSLYLMAVAAVASLIGQHAVRKAIEFLGRASVIIFILALTIFVSAIFLDSSHAKEEYAGEEYAGGDLERGGVIGGSEEFCLPFLGSIFIVRTVDEWFTCSQLGCSAELAAVGVSTSVFNLVSKLFNVPLLNVTTSFVAEEQAVVNKRSNDHKNFSQG
ncbi:hypothetical protein QQ045_007526 [Rhodiola kirilowii]